MMTTTKKMKIVIAGGGFAGLSAAMYLDKRLARRPDIDVTLVSRENFVLFTPMLHEVAAGELSPGDIVNPIRRILRHVKFVQAEVHRVDMDVRAVRCIGGVGRLEVDLDFDHLILALVGGAGRPRLGQHQPVGDLPVRVVVMPGPHDVGDVGDPRAENEGQALGLDRPLVAR